MRGRCSTPRNRFPDEVITDNGAMPARRFAVHRNNVVAGLVKALQTRFPAVRKIVGEDFFAAMARIFVAQRPPRTPMLAIYGDEFATFIAAFEPARELAYLADVARLEAARTRAYHAADAAPVERGEFAALDPNAVGRIRVALHPSIEIVRSLTSDRHDLGDELGRAGARADRELARRGRPRGPRLSRRGSPRVAAGRRGIPASHSRKADRLARRLAPRSPTIRNSTSPATSRGSSARTS